MKCLLHRSARNVEEFGSDGLLTGLVVLECELAEQFVGVVGCNLHGDDAGGVF